MTGHISHALQNIFCTPLIRTDPSWDSDAGIIRKVPWPVRLKASSLNDLWLSRTATAENSDILWTVAVGFIAEVSVEDRKVVTICKYNQITSPPLKKTTDKQVDGEFTDTL